MAEEKLVLDSSVEAFIKALRTRLTPAAKERLKALDMDPDKKLKSTYAFDAWNNAILAMREELFPSLPPSEGFRKLGELFIDGYRETIVGKTVMTLAKLLGVRKTLGRMTQNFRSANNYSETRLEQKGPTHYELWVNEVGPFPDFTAGILVAGLRAVGAQDLSVKPNGYDGHSVTYRVEWKEA